MGGCRLASQDKEDIIFITICCRIRYDITCREATVELYNYIVADSIPYIVASMTILIN